MSDPHLPDPPQARRDPAAGVGAVPGPAPGLAAGLAPGEDGLVSLISAVPMPLMLIGQDQRIRALNPAGAALFGAGAVGRPILTVIRQPAFLEMLEQALTAGQAGQVRIVRNEGAHESSFRVTLNPVSGLPGSGAALGRRAVLAAFADISDHEKIEEMRRDFVANVSHELRTPLTALLGFIETLRGAARDDAAARERFLSIMEREAGRMNRLVRDLLSLSRVESEERMRPGERVEMVGLVRAAMTALKPLAEQAGVELVLTGAEAPIHLLADSDQMTQVFSNLVENAIKYGQPGKRVTVAISREARELGLRGPSVRFEVIDEGEGIDAIHLPRLTERFYRVDTHRSREKGGTGLGLAIVKHIVNRHRGRLKVESEKGKGSRFIVILPEQ